MDIQPTFSQALNDLLSALPEMFPGVQENPSPQHPPCPTPLKPWHKGVDYSESE